MKQDKLREYIKNGKARGFSEEHIKKVLLDHGHSSTSINDSFLIMKPKERPPYSKYLAIFLLLALASFLIMKPGITGNATLDAEDYEPFIQKIDELGQEIDLKNEELDERTEQLQKQELSLEQREELIQDQLSTIEELRSLMDEERNQVRQLLLETLEFIIGHDKE